LDKYESRGGIGDSELPESLKEQAKKRQIDRTIDELRTRMMAFVDDLIQHTPAPIAPSHRDAHIKFEAFKVETASRKVLQELLEYFNARDIENDQIIKEVKA
jgi:hypothetical protein